jgi:hypothetical protein
MRRLGRVRGTTARARSTDGIPETIVEYADVLVAVLGADAVAASLAHGTNIGIKVLALRGDYSKDAVTGTTIAGADQS